MATAPASADVQPVSRQELSPEQQQQIVSAVGEMLQAALDGRPPALADATLSGSAQRPVSGAFVCLKRGKHLRSCCGFVGPPVALVRALAEAADRTAWDDVRFPPVSPTELEHLHMEVWLLYHPEPVVVTGEDRVAAVTVGRHGLKVVRGGASGLLLPGVAVDHGWDSRQFLDQVCVKAGLHPSSWRDSGTALYTFEGESIRGRITPQGGTWRRPGPACGPEEVRAYADFCLGNIVALLRGATPSYYLFGAADGQVTGVALSVRRRGSTEGLTVHQLSLRPGVPLQSTLFALTQSAAQALAQQGIREDDLPALEAAVAVFCDPVLHGTVGDPDLAGIDKRRALLIMDGTRSALVFDAAQSPQELLAEGARQAQVRRRTGAGVFSLETLTTDSRLVIANVPRPVAGPAVRPPGVAGMFYPADAAALDDQVTELLGEPVPAEDWRAAMVPHAGLRFSGHIAAAVLKRLRFPRTVIVIGPKHTPLGVEWAIAPHQTWAIPGHTIESDPELAIRLARAIPGLELDAAAHQREHGIEVELPFLARLAPTSRVVGIAIGSGNARRSMEFAAGLADVLRGEEEQPLLLISSDMNHFATDAETRVLDEMALAKLDQLDPQGLYEAVRENNISMCGVLPAVIVLETLKLLGGLWRAQRIGYATSADVTGDPSRVVGYAGMVFA
jgi:AmmeMemoRadiSam system protein B/AmmeMemoRadiSam system protein A